MRFSAVSTRLSAQGTVRTANTFAEGDLPMPTRAPTQCILWNQPDTAFRRPLQESFERLRTFIHEDHWRRYVLACRECGQRYVYEFYEEVDWIGGEDAQRTTLIPVETEDEIETVSRTAPAKLVQFTPRLERLFASDAESPTTEWIG